MDTFLADSSLTVLTLHCCLLVQEPPICEWRFSLFIGQYTFDSLVLFVFWHDLSSEFTTFYALHHSLAFFIFGAYIAVAGNWYNTLNIGFTMWIASDIWEYGFRSYKFLSRKVAALKELSRTTGLHIRVRNAIICSITKQSFR